MNRRRFLEQLSQASAIAACGGLVAGASGCIPFYYVSSSVTPEGIVVRKPELGADGVSLIAPPSGRHPILITRDEAGRLIAVSTRCTHRGCPVEPVGDRLVCPCHGSEYQRTGEVIHGPAEHPLTRYPVRETQDTLVIAWHEV